MIAKNNAIHIVNAYKFLVGSEKEFVLSKQLFLNF